MNIERVIGGKPVKIELTHSEMEAAFLWIQAEYDRIDVLNSLDDHNMDFQTRKNFKDRFGISVEDVFNNDALVDRIAAQKRHEQDCYQFDSTTAFLRALRHVLPDYLRETSQEQVPAEFMIPDTLPQKCFSVLDGELVVITRGADGYTPVAGGPTDLPECHAEATARNKALGVSVMQSKAMEFGCMFGWDLPGADPANYDADGKTVAQPENSLDSRIAFASAKRTSPARPFPQKSLNKQIDL